MSITGSSFSLHKRQRTFGDFPERLSHSEIVSHPIELSSGAPSSVSSEKLSHPPNSRHSAPTRHSLHRSSVILSDNDRLSIRASSSRPNEIRTQDARPPLPRLRSSKPPARPNEIKRLNGIAGSEQKSAIARKPGIVVIHPRAFFRDCFVRCLEISYKSHDILAFTNIGAWRDSPAECALNPSIIVFFVDRSDVSNLTDLQFLESAATDTPVVIVSDIDDVNYVVRALKGGARGYIPTSLSFNVAVEAVRLVEAGGTFVPVSSLSLDRDKQVPTTRAGDLLTERQMMVVEALCQGMANKQIAYELGMSEHTVKVHLRHIMRKLRARNRTEVAVLTKDFFDRPNEQKRLNSDGGPH